MQINRHSISKGLLMLCVWLVGATALSADDAGWTRDYEAGLRQAKASGKPVILDIYAPWCGYCRKLQREVYPSSEVRGVTDDFVRIRINGEENSELMRRYRVRAYPTIVVLDSNGSELDRINGYMPAQAFARKLRDIRRRGGREQEIQNQLKGTPESVLWNFRAGVAGWPAGWLLNVRLALIK